MVPYLIPAPTGPINELEQRLLDATPIIERWFRLEWMEHTPPLYCAVSLRSAGFKLAPVDTNLYPSCWHHLSPQTLPQAVQAAQAAVEKICPEARNLLIVPKNGTLSGEYLASLQRLREIFHMAGLNGRFGSIDPALQSSATYRLPGGKQIVVEPTQRTRHRVMLKDFDPCTVLLNNSLPAGAPGILEDLYEQHLLPPLQAGWSVRRKSQHFRCYEEVSKRFGKLIGIDPWLISPWFASCGEVDIHSASGSECVRSQVDALLGKLRRKYKEYGIAEKPFVIIKADQGGRGTGIMTVRDANELEHLLGRPPAHGKLAAAPEGEVIIQEGVLTHERIDEAVAEPVVYTIDRYVVSGFYRAHAGLRQDECLTVPGAHLVPLAFDGAALLPRPGIRGGASEPNRFYMYGVVARLALVAASYELEEADPELQEQQ
ncbi:MAG: glutamate--cysteine ligase [Burkholderiaceae bacterium]|jgi:glutamate--cysteine ligase|nr:glutamate--cysteine ligase [Burkholderiaceae bacterium]